jgi:hypothetical protein
MNTKPPGPHPAITGLLIWLADHGDEWSEEERERWIAAFLATVKVVYPAEAAPDA